MNTKKLFPEFGVPFIIINNVTPPSELQSDKASMLDDAIEYLKSLQLQVQVYTSCIFFASVGYPYSLYVFLTIQI